MIDGFDSRILQALHSRITEEIARKKDAIGEGNAQDMAAYKGMTGEIRGLNAALKIAKEIEDDARGIQRGDKP